MTVLVFGSGTRVGKILSQIDGVIAVTSQMADARRPADCIKIIEEVVPIAVIHLTADISPITAERQEALTHCINAATPTAIAECCSIMDIPLVHLSSIDVFDGTLGMPYIPSDPANPDTALGRSHLAAERGIIASGVRHGILRIAPVFDAETVLSSGHFAKVMSAGCVLAPNDVLMGPMPNIDVAHACITMAAALKNHPERSGIYHFSGSEELLLCDFLQHAADMMSEKVVIKSAPQVEIFGRKIWPTNSRLDCRTTKAVFGLDRPDWHSAFQLASDQTEFFGERLSA